jgi:NAD(P)-dependent dehydrogenase (short-subunit alcohol dehydrogenase family)
MAGRLTGKTAVVTGGNRGIGLAIAQALASEGCRVAITGRDKSALDAATKTLKSADSFAQVCDVRDPAAVKKFFADVSGRFKRLDVLVNNAGVAHELAGVESLSLDAWRTSIDTNLTGLFLVTQAALPLMSEGASIVNNLSVASRDVFPGASAYNASKAGALGFTNVLREEVRQRKIRVVALIPGATDTDIWQQFWPDAPRDNMLSPLTVAEAVVHAVCLPPEAALDEIKIGPVTGRL